MSCRFLLVTTVLLLGTVLADPQILDLKNYQAGSASVIPNVENGANLYLASNDNSDVFKNIQIVTGGNTHSLSEIAGLNADGTPKKITLSGDLSISSTNDNSITNGLTGYLYITTAAQASDNFFKVFVITGTHKISVGGGVTAVVLNTQLKTSSGDFDQPQKTTYVAEIKQQFADPKVGGLNFHWGYPLASYQMDSEKKVFFANPLGLPNQDGSFAVQYFDHVEPLQVGLDYWWFTSQTQVSMTLQNQYVPSHTYNTTAFSTTGLILNNYLFSTHVVNFQLDSTRVRTTGHLVSTILPRQNEVNFVFSDAAGNAINTTYDRENTDVYLFKQFDAQQLTVSSAQYSPGVFYCQYFTFDSTIPTTTTVTPAAGVTTSTGAPATQGTGSTLAPASAATGAVTVATGATGASSATAATGATGATGATNSPSSTTVASTTKYSRSPISDLFLLVVLIFCSKFM